MFWDYTGDKVMPNLAKGLEMQDGGQARGSCTCAAA